MSVTWDSFQRYQQKGLDARRAGQWDSARIYLLEAARAMRELSKSAQAEELKAARREMSAKLLELARDCDAARKENRRQAAPGRRGGGAKEQSQASEGYSSADPWVVHEKPAIRFDDVVS